MTPVSLRRLAGGGGWAAGIKEIRKENMDERAIG